VASGLIATFIAVEPALMAVGNLAFGRRLATNDVIAIGMGLLGVALLVRGQGFSGSPGGLVAIAIATVCWSAGSLLSGQVLQTAPGATGFATQMICGGTVLLMLSAITHESPHWPPTIQAALAWSYLVTFGSLLAFSAFLILLSSAPMPVAMSYTFVNPVIALWLGVLLAGEHVTSVEWLATGILISSVVMILRPSRNPINAS
jgi:drug/metabolite transporter (DMT)-like permease